MIPVVGIKFKEDGKIYYFDPDGITFEKDMSVIVETIRGTEFGNVEVPYKEIHPDDLQTALKKVIRIATDEDRVKHAENKEKEGSAFDICLEKIQKHGLDMNLVNVEYTFDNKKILFYFTSDGRVDFRELVKDLASVFRTRIELRQIGIRDKAKFFKSLEGDETPQNQEWWVKHLSKRGFYR